MKRALAEKYQKQIQRRHYDGDIKQLSQYRIVVTVYLCGRAPGCHAVVGLQQRIQLGRDYIALVYYALALLYDSNWSHGLLKHFFIKALCGYGVKDYIGYEKLRHGRHLDGGPEMGLVEDAVEASVGGSGRHEIGSRYNNRGIVMYKPYFAELSRLHILICRLVDYAVFKQVAQRVYEQIALVRSQVYVFG